MKLSLITAIRYLEENCLAKGTVIRIECWYNQGQQLQKYTSNWEGTTHWNEPFLDGQPEFKLLLKQLAEQDLCLQFIDSYPNVDDEDNLRILVMHRSMLAKLLAQVDALPTFKFEKRPRFCALRSDTITPFARA